MKTLAIFGLLFVCSFCAVAAIPKYEEEGEYDGPDAPKKVKKIRKELERTNYDEPEEDGYTGDQSKYKPKKAKPEYK